MCRLVYIGYWRNAKAKLNKLISYCRKKLNVYHNILISNIFMNLNQIKLEKEILCAHVSTCITEFYAHYRYIKQEAHGPHRSPEKTVQINYIITLIKKEEKILTL